eukprot:3916087-Ditylum_brightwellii.AAC.2
MLNMSHSRTEPLDHLFGGDDDVRGYGRVHGDHYHIHAHDDDGHGHVYGRDDDDDVHENIHPLHALKLIPCA